MIGLRWVPSAMMACVLLAASTASSPAAAQFFFKPHDFTADTSGATAAAINDPMPGATPAEASAAAVWTLRAALNVAALQCQFAPTLLTVSNYNALLADHADELKTSYDTVGKYFTRTAKTKAEGQTASDQFGTRIYSEFSTVSAQYGFCQTAATIGQMALFTPRGGLAALAGQELGALRASLVPYGEQQFPGGIASVSVRMPRLDKECWSRKDVWNVKKCGPDPFAVNDAAS